MVLISDFVVFIRIGFLVDIVLELSPPAGPILGVRRGFGDSLRVQVKAQDVHHLRRQKDLRRDSLGDQPSEERCWLHDTKLCG